MTSLSQLFPPSAYLENSRALGLPGWLVGESNLGSVPRTHMMVESGSLKEPTPSNCLDVCHAIARSCACTDTHKINCKKFKKIVLIGVPFIT